MHHLDLRVSRIEGSGNDAPEHLMLCVWLKLLVLALNERVVNTGKAPGEVAIACGHHANLMHLVFGRQLDVFNAEAVALGMVVGERDVLHQGKFSRGKPKVVPGSNPPESQMSVGRDDGAMLDRFETVGVLKCDSRGVRPAEGKYVDIRCEAATAGPGVA